MLYVVIILSVIFLTAVLFLTVHPVFGGNPSKEQKEWYEQFTHYANGKFTNQVPTTTSMSASDMFSLMKDSLSGNKDRHPGTSLPVAEINWDKIRSEDDHVTWFGHSAFLLKIDQKNILVDPMLGSIASPVSFAGSKRYSEGVLSIIDDMPSIDAVLITHDHYDHLDYPSIRKLKSKVQHFFVPHGVGAHLLRWGIEKKHITELNWWEEVDLHGTTIVFTPSKHFSGRGLFNRDTTLWGGWVILGQRTRVYTSGDGGYDTHFKEIGEKYGPFDLTLIEGGQYDRRWSWVHMTPEEAVRAHQDANGKQMMLIHWAAFTLAYHSWKEPVERALRETKKADVNLITPQIGETVSLSNDLHTPFSSWWNTVEKETKAPRTLNS
ncbi:MBL fold metallo-hydrolase [Metabacillus iocasae]|uniref:L-ascorbate metabolism protein UlaG (Beta-lactamase superfamily) n=1 Tax=Priestia iocasae TaxID=2291674 RepID=A0ABS2QS23_9BACI|nr:MBL fold metallo-hydrolase [Metabacillus iocasae]MBM7702265.1 L-ascorbate metabolism protein UlaG (beta-lactamase superfamily) [Metabacillus iocasae]